MRDRSQRIKEMRNRYRARGRMAPLVSIPAAFLLGLVAYGFAELGWRGGIPGTWDAWLAAASASAVLAVAGVIGAWMLWRASRLLGPTAMTSNAWLSGLRPLLSERTGYYARWLIQLRWAAVLIALGLVFVADTFAWLPHQAVLAVAAAIVVLALVNTAYAALLQFRVRLRRLLLHVQAYADLVFLGLLLHWSGGIENPMWVALIFHVAIAGIVFERRHCYAVAAAAAAVFALIAGGEATGVLEHTRLRLWPHAMHAGEAVHAAHSLDYVLGIIAVLTATLFLVAYFVTELGERIRYDERQLTNLADQAVLERRRLEQALMATETGLCVLDQDLNPRWTNTRWDAWFREVPVAAIRRTLAGDEAPALEVTAKGETVGGWQDPGSESVYRLTTGAIGGAASREREIVVLAQDVTEHKRAQAQMVQAERLAAVGELVGHVAHEVNNPIGVLSAKSRLLASDRQSEMSPEVAREVDKITDLADRVAAIIQGLLSHSRPSHAPRERIDIRRPLREAVALVEVRARRMGVDIHRELDARLPPMEGNAGELEQVFLNLLLNALDGMQAGGRLTVRAVAEPAGRVSVDVEDTGVGIPSEIQGRVLEPFFSTKPPGEGTGLGLSVCAGLVEGHRGSMHIKSQRGVGTTVHIQLPACTEGA